MNRYFKLVNFELGRFMKIYIILLGITLISQIAGIIVKSKVYLNLANQEIYENMMSQTTFIEKYGTVSLFNLFNSLWFMAPIALCVAGIAFYIFLIWYRDWFGKNTFIYRLLMLPTTRLNILFAKATSIMLMVMGLVSLQLILLTVESKILQWMVPKDFRTDFGIADLIGGSQYLQILIPQSFIEFILYYGAGFMVVLILFTAILFERSYRLKGALTGIVYSALAVGVFLAPILVQVFLRKQLFYPIEILIMEIVMGLIVIAASIWVSGFLLKNKINV